MKKIKAVEIDELIKKIILYKKSPTNYHQIPDEIRINMKLFNNVFEKLIQNSSVECFFNLAQIKAF